jgi:hypothetical protein
MLCCYYLRAGEHEVRGGDGVEEDRGTAGTSGIRPGGGRGAAGFGGGQDSLGQIMVALVHQGETMCGGA